MSKSNNEVTIPRSMRQKRILDMAVNDPEASIDELAAEIPSATPDLVEHVLEEYGDPAEVASDSTDAPEQLVDHQDTDAPPIPDLDELSAKQIEILELLQNYPDANQQDLADKLGVSNATISNRVNAIPGFDWSKRRELLDQIADHIQSHSPDDTTPPMTTKADQQPSEDLSQRVDAIENRIDDLTTGSNTCFEDPELAHKVVHACMQSDTISEDEELRILKDLIQ